MSRIRDLLDDPAIDPASYLVILRGRRIAAICAEKGLSRAAIERITKAKLGAERRIKANTMKKVIEHDHWRARLSTALNFAQGLAVAVKDKDWHAIADDIIEWEGTMRANRTSIPGLHVLFAKAKSVVISHEGEGGVTFRPRRDYDPDLSSDLINHLKSRFFDREEPPNTTMGIEWQEETPPWQQDLADAAFRLECERYTSDPFKRALFLATGYAYISNCRSETQRLEPLLGALAFVIEAELIRAATDPPVRKMLPKFDALSTTSDLEGKTLLDAIAAQLKALDRLLRAKEDPPSSSRLADLYAGLAGETLTRLIEGIRAEYPSENGPNEQPPPPPVEPGKG